MKKLSYLLLTLALLTLTGCTLKTNEWWNTPNSWTTLTDTIPYSWELIVAWVGPDESFEQTIAADTLALKQTFEDHSDHVFIDRQSWSNYLDIQDDLVPWNIVKLVGAVKALDAAAGNHYYQVVTIDQLTKIWTPSQADVEALIQRYGYCETDDDCIGEYGRCPIWCQIAINKKYKTTVEKIIDTFRNTQFPQCTYKCMEIKKVGCNERSQCVVE
jgi:hypothetical protein